VKESRESKESNWSDGGFTHGNGAPVLPDSGVSRPGWMLNEKENQRSKTLKESNEW
jgi:hypothetical protein